MNNIGVIVIIGAVILALVIFAASRKSKAIPAKPNPVSEQVKDFPPVPKWKPNVPVDVERTIKTFAYYTDAKKTFAVFAHGTCVPVSPTSADPEKEAKDVLSKIYNYHPDFNPQQMDDGNYSISYSQPAYSIVFKDEVEKNRDYIDQNHLDGVVRDEVLLNAERKPNKFDEQAKIGLFGRARMFLDAQNPVVVKVWKPSN